LQGSNASTDARSCDHAGGKVRDNLRRCVGPNPSGRIISLIFHDRYQWDKRRARWRNEAAMGEHFATLRALRSGDVAAAEPPLPRI